MRRDYCLFVIHGNRLDTQEHIFAVYRELTPRILLNMLKEEYLSGKGVRVNDVIFSINKTARCTKKEVGIDFALDLCDV